MSYTRTTNGTNPKSEKITESYRIYCGPAYAPSNGTTAQKSGLFNTKVIKVEKGFEDRLYLVNNILDHYPQAERAVWNNPTGGSLEWGGYPQVGIIDTKGFCAAFIQLRQGAASCERLPAQVGRIVRSRSERRWWRAIPDR